MMARRFAFGAFGMLGVVLASACVSSLDLGDRGDAGSSSSVPAEASVSESGLGDGSRPPPVRSDASPFEDPSDAGFSVSSTCGSARYCAVFVTSATFLGDLGGLSGADRKCNDAAQTAGLVGAGRFKAYLASTTTAAWARFSSRGPWALVGASGVIFADPAALRLNGSNVPDRDESGASILGPQYWTGAGAQGAPADTCVNFTSDDPFGFGHVGAWPNWISSHRTGCGGLPRAILCLED